MKKLTKDFKHYYKSIMYDLIYRELNLKIFYKYKISFDINYDNTSKTNKIIIKITSQFRKDFSGCDYRYFKFYNNSMVEYNQYYLSNSGYCDHKNISCIDLSLINIVNDNHIEVFKNL